MNPTGSDSEKITNWAAPTAFLPNLTWFPSPRGQCGSTVQRSAKARSQHIGRSISQRRGARRALGRSPQRDGRVHRTGPALSAASAASSSAATTATAAAGRAAAAAGRRTPARRSARVAAPGPPAAAGPSTAAARIAAPGHRHREDHADQCEHHHENSHHSHRPPRSPDGGAAQAEGSGGRPPRRHVTASCDVRISRPRGRGMPPGAQSQSRLEQLQRFRAGWPP